MGLNEDGDGVLKEVVGLNIDSFVPEFHHLRHCAKCKEVTVIAMLLVWPKFWGPHLLNSVKEVKVCF